MDNAKLIHWVALSAFQITGPRTLTSLCPFQQLLYILVKSVFKIQEMRGLKVYKQSFLYSDNID